jgi:ethanolamine utilization protein EutA (predicted chaperonin)
MIEADVPVVWIVVPVEAVATTVVGAPVDELDKSVFTYVAIYIPIRILGLLKYIGQSQLLLQVLLHQLDQ